MAIAKKKKPWGKKKPKQKGVLWFYQIKKFLDTPKRPSEIQEEFQITKGLFRILNQLVKLGEIRKIKQGRNSWYVKIEYQPIQPIVIQELLRLASGKVQLKLLPSNPTLTYENEKSKFLNLLHLKELFENTAIMLGRDPENAKFREEYFQALKNIQKSVEDSKPDSVRNNLRRELRELNLGNDGPMGI